MDSFSTWQQELDSNASPQRYQIATASYPACAKAAYSFLLAAPSLTSRADKAKKKSSCLGTCKRLCSRESCVPDGCAVVKLQESVLSVGSWPAAECLSSRQWHSTAAELPFKQKLHEKKPSGEQKPRETKFCLAPKPDFIFSDAFSAECTFYVFYWKIAQ